MNYKEVMAELEAMGTEQNRKVYGRHGVSGKMYGVSYANLGKLKKKIKTDHALAERLWASGNHDARVLATMIADPAQITGPELEAWIKDLDNYVLTDAFSGLAEKTAHAKAKMRKWTKSKEEWVGRAGYLLVARIAMSDESLGDDELEERLAIIEAGIHNAKNRVRDAMNNALIAIALKNQKLERKAVAAAKRIGKVDVDHGETGCKTPEAVAYIKKAKARGRKGRKSC
ncbi:MAG: DNA alkylation repair protein [Candidatus Latescibacterota bacterium]|nr:MAG: DNA alkylation repair protein [Candidatus Latescibacterota bacterium]